MTKREWRKLAIFIAEMVVALAISLWIDRSFVQQIAEPIEFKPLVRLATVAQVAWNLGVTPWLWLLAGLIAALIIAWRAGPLGPGAARVPAGSRRARIFIAALTGFGLGVGIARAPADPAAFLLYGPYLTLPAGSYAVDIAFVCADNAAANVFDATARAGTQVLAVARLEPGDPRCNGSNQTMTLPLVLKQAAGAVEFRTFFGGHGTLKVTGLILRREQ